MTPRHQAHCPPGSYVSSTIRTFSAAVHRLRRCTDVITSILPVIDTVILLTLTWLETVSGHLRGRFMARYIAVRHTTDGG